MGLRLWVAPISAGLPFLTFFPATALAAIFFGFGPGLMVAGLGSLLAGGLFLPPLSEGNTIIWSQVVFLADALLICWAVDAMHCFREGHQAAVRDLIKVNQTLESANAQLKASNEDLEQFAYVASHDLQEPLRMVVSYGQLLNKRYHDTLDEDTKDFIGFMVEGSSRMQAMVTDLLRFSRLSHTPDDLERFEASDAMAECLEGLSITMAGVNARITCDHMPAIVYDRTQFIRLMQNLLDNALKYRDPQQDPEITVTAHHRDAKTVFAVTDHGIGIDPQYFDQIFRIFQRLHARDQYEGTGIGLAVCKKIVERHGGRIWVESGGPGQGTTFFFTILDAATKA